MLFLSDVMIISDDLSKIASEKHGVWFLILPFLMFRPFPLGHEKFFNPCLMISMHTIPTTGPKPVKNKKPSK